MNGSTYSISLIMSSQHFLILGQVYCMTSPAQITGHLNFDLHHSSHSMIPPPQHSFISQQTLLSIAPFSPLCLITGIIVTPCHSCQCFSDKPMDKMHRIALLGCWSHANNIGIVWKSKQAGCGFSSFIYVWKFIQRLRRPLPPERRESFPKQIKCV